jgi:hypothetical protein
MCAGRSKYRLIGAYSPCSSAIPAIVGPEGPPQAAGGEGGRTAGRRLDLRRWRDPKRRMGRFRIRINVHRMSVDMRRRARAAPEDEAAGSAAREQPGRSPPAEPDVNRTEPAPHSEPPSALPPRPSAGGSLAEWRALLVRGLPSIPDPVADPTALRRYGPDEALDWRAWKTRMMRLASAFPVTSAVIQQMPDVLSIREWVDSHRTPILKILKAEAAVKRDPPR